MRNYTSIYYKISKQGFPDSYLFGTIHFRAKRMPGLANFQPELSIGFKEAEQFICEEDLSKRYTSFFQKGNLARLDSVLFAGEIQEFKQYLSQFDRDAILRAPFETINDLFRWLKIDDKEVESWPFADAAVVLNLLGQEDFEAHQKYSNLIAQVVSSGAISEILDKELLALAKAKGINIIDLDSQDNSAGKDRRFTDSIIEAYRTISPEKLKEKILKLNDSNSTMLFWFIDFLKQYIEAAFRYDRQAFNKSPDFDLENIRDKKLIERNEEWIEKLKSLLKIKSFIAVGAGHLFGKKGLIELLEKEGFQLDSVECPRQSLEWEQKFDLVLTELKKVTSMSQGDSENCIKPSAVKKGLHFNNKKRKHRTEVESLIPWSWEASAKKKRSSVA